MGIQLPVRVGGAIYASDSDSISDSIDVSQLPIGTKVWNQGVDAYFTLKTSVAALVTDQVLQVLNFVGLRWIVDAPLSAPITNADLSAMATHTFKANITGVTAIPTDITRTELTAELNPATTLLPGSQSINSLGMQAKIGPDLVDGDQTISPGVSFISGSFIRPGTLTGSSVFTLADTDCTTADFYFIAIQQLTGGFGCNIINAVGAVLVSFTPGALPNHVLYQFYFTGTHWAFNTRVWLP